MSSWSGVASGVNILRFYFFVLTIRIFSSLCLNDYGFTECVGSEYEGVRERIETVTEAERVRPRTVLLSYKTALAFSAFRISCKSTACEGLTQIMSQSPISYFSQYASLIGWKKISLVPPSNPVLTYILNHIASSKNLTYLGRFRTTFSKLTILYLFVVAPNFYCYAWVSLFDKVWINQCYYGLKQSRVSSVKSRQKFYIMCWVADFRITTCFNQAPRSSSLINWCF